MPILVSSPVNTPPRSFANGNGFIPKSPILKSPPSLAIRKGGSLLDTFLHFYAELDLYRAGKSVQLDGETLSLPAIVAVARFPPSTHIILSEDPTIRSRVDKSRQLIVNKLEAGKSIYGVSTGFGGSADTRTNLYTSLGVSVLQHQHVGILPSDLSNPADLQWNFSGSPLPLLPPSSTSMPSPWVRGALLVRINTLIRGHSGVRWSLMESMTKMINKDIVPVVPLRGSISASGDLSPLSYIAGALMGFPHILVQCNIPSPEHPLTRQTLPASHAFSLHGLEPVTLQPKEHLGIVNGTGFSASLGALIAFESVGAIVLGEVCTAMGTEALLGTQANFAPFISHVRPHPGQIEASNTLYHLLSSSSLASSAASHNDQVNITADAGELRQDRYSLRTAPQWIGPLIEDVLSAVRTVEIECNSTTDNPLLDPSLAHVHHGGNFQALALTTAFEKNPAFNRGLPPNVAATDPSLNFHAKGLDIAMASYVSELGWLSSNVVSNVQSAEMHNHSLALISGRATLSALEVLNMLLASYFYVLCQALDLRALQKHYNAALTDLVTEELATHFSPQLPKSDIPSLCSSVLPPILASLDATSTMDALPRLKTVAGAAAAPILDFFSTTPMLGLSGTDVVSAIDAFRASFAQRGAQILQELRYAFLHGMAPSPKGMAATTSAYNPLAPAAPFLGQTRPVYEYIRLDLGVRIHGVDNWNGFDTGLGHTKTEPGIGKNVSIIYEAIRDGKLQAIVAKLCRNAVHFNDAQSA